MEMKQVDGNGRMEKDRKRYLIHKRRYIHISITQVQTHPLTPPQMPPQFTPAHAWVQPWSKDKNAVRLLLLGPDGINPQLLHVIVHIMHDNSSRCLDAQTTSAKCQLSFYRFLHLQHCCNHKWYQNRPYIVKTLTVANGNHFSKSSKSVKMHQERS